MTASGWALQVKDMRTGDRASKGASRAVWYERHESALFLDQRGLRSLAWQYHHKRRKSQAPTFRNFTPAWVRSGNVLPELSLLQAACDACLIVEDISFIAHHSPTFCGNRPLFLFGRLEMLPQGRCSATSCHRPLPAACWPQAQLRPEPLT